MADDANQGQREARTPRENLAPGADPSAKPAHFELADVLERFTEAQQADEFDLLAMLEASIENGQTDTLAKMADSVVEERRARGRPQGSKNRRNTDVFDYLEGLGHRPPEVVLSLIATTDPRQIAVMMRRHKHFGAALDKVIKAASELLPYKLAKRTPDVALLPDEKTPLLIMHRLPMQAKQTGGPLGVGLFKDEPIIENDGQ